MGALLFALIVACVIVMGYIDSLTSQSITGAKSSVNIILGFEVINWVDIFGAMRIPWINIEWVTAFWDALTWNFWFLGGVNQHTRTLVALLITAMGLWGILASPIPGYMITAASTTLQGVRAGIGGIFRLIGR